MTEESSIDMNELKITPELVSIHSCNPFFDTNSSPRSIMMASHLSQRLIIKGQEEKIIQSGIERELGKTTINIKIPCNAKIIGIIKRYRKNNERDNIPYSPEDLIIYENIDNNKYGCVSIPKYGSEHQYFGYDLEHTDEYEQISINDNVPKDTVLADTVSKSDNGGYKFGINLNTIFNTDPAVAEDGIKISRDVLDKLSFNIYEKRQVEFGNNKFPLNLYGTEDEYKPFPEMGERIHHSGMLMALRSYDVLNSPILLNKASVMTPDITMDEPIYVRGDTGKVIDVKVFKSPTNKPGIYSNISGTLEKYRLALERFYKELLNIEQSLRLEQYNKFGNYDINLEPNLHRLLVEAYSIVYGKHTITNRNGESRIKKLFRGTPVDQYRVEFVIKYTITPTIGFKLTDLHGGKGVICSIEEPENMPVDETGVRADIIIDSSSVTSRMNLGRLYEQYIGQASETLTRQIRANILLDKLERLPDMTKNDILKIMHAMDPNGIMLYYGMLTDFYNLISPKQAAHYSNITDINDKIEILANIVYDRIYIFYPIGNEIEHMQVVQNIENSVFKPHIGQLTYVNRYGDHKKTIEKTRIGPVYFMLLEKIADSWLSASSARVNHFGVPISVNKTNRHQTPFRLSPTKTIGESESRLYLSYVGGEAIAELMDRSKNRQTHKDIYNALLESDNPGLLEDLTDVITTELGNDKVSNQISHMLECAGIEIVYEPEEHPN